ncbi:MAG: CPBP family intramembrane metalloprotease [Marinicaulis sp.]|nr:CPBP family intramembrane metalloprotease [Marinicaulis sp.]NNE41365.1 CPBP family intramembrane metalloprotease [Marinicaulis sp.]NNL87867.1 CPBP family intramembrane metalloprotease [Marinicaulis sp.]
MTEPEEHASDDGTSFAVAILGTTILAVIGLGLAHVAGVPIAPQIKLKIDDVLLGVIATLPLGIFLYWFSQTSIPSFAEFRESQIDFFSKIGFQFTPMRIVAMALAAGVGEEILFRGFLQSWINSFSPVVIAIIVSNIVFGLLHMRTVLYAVIAGLVGAYLGVVFAVTDNLLTPMVTHFAYDLLALEYTRNAIAARGNSNL